MSKANHEIQLSKASKQFCHLMGWAITHNSGESEITYRITRIANSQYLGTIYKFPRPRKYGIVSSAFNILEPFEYKGQGQVVGLRKLAQYIAKMEKKND